MSKTLRFAGLLTVALLAAACSFAQSIKGTVTDSTGKAVPYANISLKNSSNLIVAYGISNIKGGYVLNIPANTIANNLLVEVTCLGYKKQSKTVSDVSFPLDFKLSASVNQLQTVTVKDNHPRVRTSGDTLGYKVSDFSSPQDRVIGDVIKKLPGVSVATDGKISYNGKAISNLYIGGDNLLDDKYNIATNTIPHGAVDQVQVIENHQPIKMLQNKVVSDDVAINLTIKKDAKLQLIGQETIGVGLPGNYDMELNAMLFKDKYKAINYLKGNNIGYNVANDVISHNYANYLQGLNNDKPASILSLGTINPPNLAENRYLFDQSGIFNINNLINLKKSVQLRVNLYYLHDTQRQDYNTQTQVYLPNDTVRYTETQHNKYRPDVLRSQFTLNINRDKYYLNDALVASYNHSTSYSLLNANGTPLNQVLKDNTTDFSNEFNFMRGLKSGNIVEAYSYINHTTEPENRVIDPGYNAAIFNSGAPYAQLQQTANVPTWFTNNYLSYKVPYDSFTQTYKAGFLVQSQTLSSALDVFQNNNSVNLASDSSLNQLNWSRKKLYAEAGFDAPGKIWKVSLTLPVSLQQIHYADSLYHTDKSLNRVYFNPQLKVKYQVSTENFFTLLYNYRNNIGNIQDVYNGYILKDYRSLYANNADLTESKDQFAAFGFNYRKAITLFFFNVNAVYNHIVANNITSSIVTNSLQQRIVLPFTNAVNSLSLNGYISKYDFALRTTFSGGIQWQNNHSIQVQNNALLPYNTISTSVNASAETKVSSQVTFSYKATGTQTASHTPADVSSHTIKQLIQEAALNYNPTQSFQFKLSGDHYYTYQQTNSLHYFFADASAKYRFTKLKADAELSANNFLNVKNYSTLYLSANTFTASSYTLPGRIVLLKVMFNI